MLKIILHFLIILSIVGLILPSFSFIQAADQPPKMPETLDDILLIGKKALNPIPQALKGVWQEAVAIWQKVADFAKNLWDSYIFPFFKNIWQKILSFLGKEIEVKKQEIKEEAEKGIRERFKEWVK